MLKVKKHTEKRKIKPAPVKKPVQVPLKVNGRIVLDYALIRLCAQKGFSDKDIADAIKIDNRTFNEIKKREIKLRALLDNSRKKLIEKSPGRYNVKEGRIIFSGQPTTYKAKYCKMMIEYFNSDPYKVVNITEITKDGESVSKEVLEPNDLPLLSGFAISIGVNRDTLKDWAEKHQEFALAYQMCKDIQDRNLITNGLRGLYNPSYAQLVSKNYLGMKDMKDVTSDNKPIQSKTYMIPSFRNEEEDEEE